MLPRRPGQHYRNFISYIQGQTSTHNIGYWRQYLENVVPCYFPALIQGSNRRAGSGAIDILFDAFQLHAFRQQYGLSVYSVLQTAWALLLSTFIGENQVYFGYSASVREIPVHEMQHAVGPYIGVLICQVGFSPAESISDVLRRVHNDFVNSLSHQHTCSLAETVWEASVQQRDIFTKRPVRNVEQQRFKLRNITMDDPSEVRMILNMQ